jgi:hypothetical protein
MKVGRNLLFSRVPQVSRFSKPGIPPPLQSLVGPHSIALFVIEWGYARATLTLTNTDSPDLESWVELRVILP